MNVLFITTSYPTPEDPASGVFVHEHARATALHAKVAIVHLERRAGASAPYRVEWADGEPPVWRVTYPYRPLPLSVACHFAAALAGYRAARRSGFRPDVLHAHFFLAAGPGSVISLMSGTPLVATEQWTAFLPHDPTKFGLGWQLAARVALRCARLIMPVSENLAGAMYDAGVRGTFRVVPNAVDVALFRPGRGESGRLLTVGLLGPQKGIDVLLRALALIPEGVELDIVGDGPSRDEYERLAQDLGLHGRVAFHGLQPKPRIAELMRHAALFVLASRYDNNPCVLIEAQAAGLPIVSSQVGGIPEIVGGYGLLVAPDDPSALAVAVREVLHDPGRWSREAIAAHARTRYSLEAVGSELSDVYRSVLE